LPEALVGKAAQFPLILSLLSNLVKKALIPMLLKYNFSILFLSQIIKEPHCCI